MTDEKKLAASYQAADRIMKERAVSFYHAFSHIPAERFQGVTAVYAFCRYADDLVDCTAAKGGTAAVSDRLDELEQLITRICSDAVPSGSGTDRYPAVYEPWWPAFEDTVTRCRIPAVGFLMQIDGQRLDMAPEDIQDTDELIRYCRLVAGSVGRMMLPFLARSEVCTDEPLIEACEQLGIAMQITNILRDVGEDLREKNKVYIPASLLTEYGVGRETLAVLAHRMKDEPAQPVPEPFIRLWEALAATADRYYLPYQKMRDCFHPQCFVPLFAAAKMYQAIAGAVRAAAYNCFTQRCYTDTETRKSILLEAQSLK